MAPTEKAVLISLADQANDAGVCWPSVASLCERTCLGARTVQRALRELEAAGLLWCAVAAMKSNKYTLAVAKLRALQREREQAAEALAWPSRAEKGGEGEEAAGGQGTPATVAPLPPPQWHPTPATVAPPPRHSGTQTVIEPNTNTPHTPQAALEGLASRPVKSSRASSSPQGMAAWLEAVKARGEDAIPADDPVFRYAERVGLSRDLVALCWREFKRRMLAGQKRQKDWRRHFRNCVEGSWYGLWAMRAGSEAMLTSKGEQVQRYFAAEDAEQAGQGDLQADLQGDQSAGDEREAA